MNDAGHLLQCGGFIFRILGDTISEKMLSSRVQQYLCEESISEKIDVLLSCRAIPDCVNPGDGWSFCANELESILTYSSGNKALFSVTYREGQPELSLQIGSRSNSMIALQHAVMIALAGKCIGFHGVTVICKDRAIILSAPSGTGKTTLAKLLQKYCESAVVNGDFALLSMDPEHGLMFEPTPFCGSSGVCHNVRLPIDRIVFLEQGKTNVFENLNVHQAMLRMMNNTFIPEKDALLSARIQEQILRIVEAVPISRFSFEPTGEAAHAFYESVIQ